MHIKQFKIFVTEDTKLSVHRALKRANFKDHAIFLNVVKTNLPCWIFIYDDNDWSWRGATDEGSNHIPTFKYEGE